MYSSALVLLLGAAAFSVGTLLLHLCCQNLGPIYRSYFLVQFVSANQVPNLVFILRSLVLLLKSKSCEASASQLPDSKVDPQKKQNEKVFVG